MERGGFQSVILLLIYKWVLKTFHLSGRYTCGQPNLLQMEGKWFVSSTHTPISSFIKDAIFESYLVELLTFLICWQGLGTIQ